MARAAEELVVDAPLTAVYNQWTQFEEFPRFMEAVQEVRQLDDQRLHWKASIAGRDVEWEAAIIEQVPDEKIIWRSIDGKTNAGMVSFRPVDAGRTEIHLEMSYEPEGLTESVGNALGMLGRQVKQDLENFKEFIEERGGMPTGEWRGEIANPRAPDGHTQGQGTPDIE